LELLKFGSLLVSARGSGLAGHGEEVPRRRQGHGSDNYRGLGSRRIPTACFKIVNPLKRFLDARKPGPQKEVYVQVDHELLQIVRIVIAGIVKIVIARSRRRKK